MSDKKNADHTDRLSPEELFDRFSDDSFSSLLADNCLGTESSLGFIVQ